MPGIVYTIDAQTSGFLAKVDQASARLRDVTKSAGEGSAGGDFGLGALVGKIGLASAALQGLREVSRLAGDGIRDAMSFESVAVQFGVLIGSAEKAKAKLAEIQQFADTTPLHSDELQAAARSLLAFGTSQRDVIPELRMLGDIAAGTGSRIGDLAAIYGKARVQGRLFQEDINQFGGRGIDIVTGLTAKYDVSAESLRKMTEEGKIGFQDLKDALMALTEEGGRFHGMLDQVGQTAEGRLSTEADAATASWREFGRVVNSTGLSIESAKYKLSAFLGDVSTAGVLALKKLGGLFSLGAPKAVSFRFDGAPPPGALDPLALPDALQERVDAEHEAATAARRAAKVADEVLAGLKSQGGPLGGLAVAGGLFPKGTGAESEDARRARVDAAMQARLQADAAKRAQEATERAAIMERLRANEMERWQRAAEAGRLSLQSMGDISGTLGNARERSVRARARELSDAGIGRGVADNAARAEADLAAADAAEAATPRALARAARDSRRAAAEGRRLARAMEWLDGHPMGPDRGESMPFGLSKEIDRGRDIRRGLTQDKPKTTEEELIKRVDKLIDEARDTNRKLADLGKA